MSKTSYLLFFLFFTVLNLIAQEQNKKPESANTPKIAVKDSLFLGKIEVDPISPSKAAFYSAVLPGLGQAYNKKYWKIPIVYGLIGGGVYLYQRNDKLYDRYRDAFKRRRAGFNDDEFWGTDPGTGAPLASPRLSTQALQDGQERFQRSRDLSLLLSVVFYALNILDANVDAHLRQYNMSDKLSLNIQPYASPANWVTQDPNVGLHLTLNIH